MKSKTFVVQYLGKTFFLFKAANVMEKETWVKCIQDAQSAMMLKEQIFEEISVVPRSYEKFNCSIGFGMRLHLYPPGPFVFKLSVG